MKRKLILLYWKWFREGKYNLYLERQKWLDTINDLKRRHKRYKHLEVYLKLATAKVELNFKNWR
jgi:hypothetical protein